jgi:hypothetical protein
MVDDAAPEQGSHAQLLSGGVDNAGQVMRVGDVVRRPAPPNARTIHDLLRHLHARGFPAPMPTGPPVDGYERVTFIDGAVAISPYPAWAYDDSVLASVGRLMRAYHQSVADYRIPPGASWNTELADPHGGDVLCHNDVCLENVVFSSGTGAALLDFDFAAPGRPIWDVVHTARYWVPLTDPTLPSARPLLDPFARLRILADAYGLNAAERASFPAVLVDVERVAVQFVEGRVQRGLVEFQKMWTPEAQARHALKMSWIDRNTDRLLAALLD